MELWGTGVVDAFFGGVGVGLATAFVDAFQGVVGGCHFVLVQEKGMGDVLREDSVRDSSGRPRRRSRATAQQKLL